MLAEPFGNIRNGRRVRHAHELHRLRPADEAAPAVRIDLLELFDVLADDPQPHPLAAHRRRDRLDAVELPQTRKFVERQQQGRFRDLVHPRHHVDRQHHEQAQPPRLDAADRVQRQTEIDGDMLLALQILQQEIGLKGYAPQLRHVEERGMLHRHAHDRPPLVRGHHRQGRSRPGDDVMIRPRRAVLHHHQQGVEGIALVAPRRQRLVSLGIALHDQLAQPDQVALFLRALQDMQQQPRNERAGRVVPVRVLAGGGDKRLRDLAGVADRARGVVFRHPLDFIEDVVAGRREPGDDPERVEDENLLPQAPHAAPAIAPPACRDHRELTLRIDA